jgi:hypothetical protein
MCRLVGWLGRCHAAHRRRPGSAACAHGTAMVFTHTGMQKLVGNIPPVSTELLQTLLKIKTLTKDFKTYIPDFKDRVRILAYIGTVGGPCGCAPTCPAQSAPSHSGLAVVLVDAVVRQAVRLSRQRSVVAARMHSRTNCSAG